MRASLKKVPSAESRRRSFLTPPALSANGGLGPVIAPKIVPSCSVGVKCAERSSRVASRRMGEFDAFSRGEPFRVREATGDCPKMIEETSTLRINLGVQGVVLARGRWELAHQRAEGDRFTIAVTEAIMWATAVDEKCWNHDPYLAYRADSQGGRYLDGLR